MSLEKYLNPSCEEVAINELNRLANKAQTVTKDLVIDFVKLSKELDVEALERANFYEKLKNLI